MELRSGMELMVNGVAVHLNSLAEIAGEQEWWWVTLLFVEPAVELVEFDSHAVYTSLHSTVRRAKV